MREGEKKKQREGIDHIDKEEDGGKKVLHENKMRFLHLNLN